MGSSWGCRRAEALGLQYEARLRGLGWGGRRRPLAASGVGGRWRAEALGLQYEARLRGLGWGVG